MIAIITLIKDLLVATVYQKIGLLRIKDDYRYSNSASDVTDLQSGKPRQWCTHDFSMGVFKSDIKNLVAIYTLANK